MQTQDKWVPWFTYALAVISTIFVYILLILVSTWIFGTFKSWMDDLLF